MSDLRINHVSVLSEDGKILKDQTVEITEGRFSRIAPADEKSENGFGTGADKMSASQVLDGRGKLLMPGLVDCYMHTGQQLLKGRV